MTKRLFGIIVMFTMALAIGGASFSYVENGTAVQKAYAVNGVDVSIDGGAATNYGDLPAAFSAVNSDISGTQIVITLHDESFNLTGQLTLDAVDGRKVTIQRGTEYNTCTINRGFAGSSLILSRSELEIDGISFDGKAGSYTSGIGGAVRVNGKDLTIKNSEFMDFHTEDNRNAYGGAVYCTGEKLIVTDSTFNNCHAGDRAGAVFHDPDAASAGESNTQITDTGFENCTAGYESSTDSGAAGALETQAVTVKISGSDYAKAYFKNCSAMFRNGGALNIYTNNHENPDAGDAEISGYSFENCTAYKSGGGLRSTAMKTTVTGCSFSGCKTTAPSGTSDVFGGGASFTNKHADSEAFVVGGSFDSCESLLHGGAVYSTTGTLSISGNAAISKCKSKDGGAVSHRNEITGTVTDISGCTITKCEASEYGGAVYSEARTINVSDGCSIGDATDSEKANKAITGGGIYVAKNSSTFNMSGGSISGNIAESSAADGAKGGGVYLIGGPANFTGGTIRGNTAEGKSNRSALGGGVYVSGGNVTISGTVISDNLTKTNSDTSFGGGIYQKGGRLTLESGTISGNDAKKGAGIYCEGNQNATFTMSGGTVSGNGNISGTDKPVTAAGGGVFLQAGTFNYTGGTISGNKAQDGGGVYQSAGTFNMSGNSVIKGNEAENGGGVYYNNGTFNFNGGSIGQEGSPNKASGKGGGIFVANNRTLNLSSGSIEYNQGAGIAIGGDDAKLNFSGKPVVRNNTKGGAACNVLLDSYKDTIVNVTGEINIEAYIGIYADDTGNIYDNHGKEGQRFGTYSNYKGIERFINDRDNKLHGTESRVNKELCWGQYVCKITDGTNILYRKLNNVYVPAVYSHLDNPHRNGWDDADDYHAFSALRPATPDLYYKEGNEYKKYGTDASAQRIDYYVEMLVEDYDIIVKGANARSNGNQKKNVILTTASKTPDAEGYSFPPDSTKTRATIIRGAGFENNMFTARGNLRFRDIILDGGSELGRKSTEHGGIAFVRKQDNNSIGRLYIESGATLQNSTVDNGGKYGGAVYINTGAEAYMDGGTITNCRNLQSNGGGVYIEVGTFTLTGGTISSCRAVRGGAVGLSHTGGTKLVISDKDSSTHPSIYDNTATRDGAGIYLGGTGSRLEIGGSVYFSNNITDHNSNYPGIANKTNGNRRVYTSGIPQDIYMPHDGSNPTPIISVTGDINTSGTIWLWVDNNSHSKKGQQFAVISIAGDVTPKGLNRFRNARPDDHTGCSGGLYLSGIRGNDLRDYKCVYWSESSDGSYKVILRKYNSSKVPVTSGVSFDISTSTGTVVGSGLTPNSAGVFYVGYLNEGKYIVTESYGSGTRYFLLIVSRDGISNRLNGERITTNTDYYTSWSDAYNALESN